MRAWWIGLWALACGGTFQPEGDLGEFGEVRRAYLVPCTVTTEAGDVPTAFGYLLSRRRSCLDGPEDILPELDHVDCDRFTRATESMQGCFSGMPSPASDVITFHLAGVGDTSDLTGATASWVELSACAADSDGSDVAEPIRAELQVLADDGSVADLSLFSAPASGEISAWVCR